MTRFTDLLGEVAGHIDAVRVDGREWLAVEGSGYYVQIMPNVDFIVGEAVSNEFLDDSCLLSDGDQAILVALGWQRPEEPCHPACHRPHPNFTRTWPASTPSTQIASDLLTTLVAVYLRNEGDMLQIKSGPRCWEPSVGAPAH